MEPPNYWAMVAHTIAIGGHVRIGMEDCPYVKPRVYAKTNAELVEKAVRINAWAWNSRSTTTGAWCRRRMVLGSSVLLPSPAELRGPSEPWEKKRRHNHAEMR